MNHPTIYQFRIKESLGEQWAEWFAPLMIQQQPEGSPLLVGAVRDQAEL